MATRTPCSPIPVEVDLTDGSDIDDAVLRRIVQSVAYRRDDPEIRAISSPRFETDRLRSAAWELLRRAREASLAARRDGELRLP